jgi:hypothetical protein
MVDALRETWRVLSPGGTLIDLRPVATDAPIDVVTTNGLNRLGTVDGASGMEDDAASDAAIDVVVSEGLFRLHTKGYFDFEYYWDDADELATDFENNWRRRRGNPTSEVLDAARTELARLDGNRRLRSCEHILIATYARSTD